MDRALESVLAVVIIGATLAFGGVQPLAYSITEICLLLTFTALLLNQTRQGKIRLAIPIWPCLFMLLAVLQIVPLPGGLLTKLSPARGLDLGLAGRPDMKSTWMTLSIYPHDTALAVVRFLAYLSAFLLASYLFDSRRRKSTLVRVLTLLGSFEAVYGIVQYLTGWERIFTYKKEYDLGHATGTYINRNHFAGLLELTIPFLIAAIFYSLEASSESQDSGPQSPAGRRSSASRFQAFSYLFLLIIMFLGVIFSHSRMGIVASLFTIVFVALLANRRTKQRIWLVGLSLFLACVVGYSLWIGAGSVLARFEEVDPHTLGMAGRVSEWKDALGIVRDYPFTGAGLGTFGIAFRRYQTTGLESTFEHAHNDYLEFASEIGLLGAALLFFPILYLFVRMVVSFLDDKRRYRRSVTLGCIGSTLALLIHSMMDFNLQITANALIFAVILGIGYKVACVERRDEGITSAPPGSR